MRPLTNLDLARYAQNIPHFRGVYMLDELPTIPRYNESGIVNLDSSHGPGTHWVAYIKRNNTVLYFDSFGNLAPPVEMVDYFGPTVEIHYNYHRRQGYNSVVCGHLCLKFLNVYSKRKHFRTLL